jgi:hypothetical protein
MADNQSPDAEELSPPYNSSSQSDDEVQWDMTLKNSVVAEENTPKRTHRTPKSKVVITPTTEERKIMEKCKSI